MLIDMFVALAVLVVTNE